MKKFIIIVALLFCASAHAQEMSAEQLRQYNAQIDDQADAQAYQEEEDAGRANALSGQISKQQKIIQEQQNQIEELQRQNGDPYQHDAPYGH